MRYIIQQVGDAECETFLFIRHEVRAGFFVRTKIVWIYGADYRVVVRDIGCHQVAHTFGGVFALLVEAVEEDIRHFAVVKVGTHDRILF